MGGGGGGIFRGRKGGLEILRENTGLIKEKAIIVGVLNAIHTPY